MSIKLNKRLKEFVDISLSFEPHPVTKDITVLKDERAINNSIKNIILTSPKQVPFEPNMGSTVKDYLFENYDPSFTPIIETEIKRAIQYNEPRVDVISVTVEDNSDRNEISAIVIYKIIGYDEVFTVTQILSQIL